jgi:hypothetical protein
LPGALDTAIGHFEQGRAQLPGSLAALNEIPRTAALTHGQAASQQAYLLILVRSRAEVHADERHQRGLRERSDFAAWLSVSSCLCGMRTSRAYSITRYNGRESAFGGPAALTEVVTEAHHALAREIRVTEGGGEEFDPRSTFQEAIRRIDIQLPVPSLAESSTVLVDTPGLYSRMNFGTTCSRANFATAPRARCSW